ncbi:hypothetical protein WN943_005691 [Citrus x changshan-huyou]
MGLEIVAGWRSFDRMEAVGVVGRGCGGNTVSSCKHFGHVAETCYVANLGLRPRRPNRATQTNSYKSKETEAPPPGTSPRASDPTPE